MIEQMKIQRMEGDAAATWLRMVFLATNPGVEAEDDWGIELPGNGSDAFDDDCLKLRTTSF